MNREEKILAEKMEELITKASIKVVADLRGDADDNGLMLQTLALGVGSRIVEVTVATIESVLDSDRFSEEMIEQSLKLRDAQLQALKKYIVDILPPLNC